MTDIAALVSDNLQLWTSAIDRKPGAGRGGSYKVSLYGIERLRALILDLAASGKLVDGVNIEAARLGGHVELVMGQAPPGNACNTTGDGTIFVKAGEFGDLYPEVREWTTKPLKLAKTGDVLICVVGATIGKLNLAIDCAIGRSVAAIRPQETLDSTYLYYSLMPYTLRLRTDARGSAQGVIGKADLNAVAIRVPSLAEQRLIVAKIEQLMALCDTLEEQSSSAVAAHQTLVETLLATLVYSSDEVDFSKAWSRLESHFDSLFISEASIDALKHAILDLAVRGKLVEQDSRDSAASELLQKVAKQREAMVSAGLAKRKKEAKATRHPYDVPASWQWSKLGEVTQLVTKGSSPKWQGISYVEPEDGLLFITSENVGNFKLRKLDELKYVESRFAEVEPRSLLKKGDILINLVGASIGRSAIYDLDVKANINQAVALVRLVDPSLGPDIEFLLMFLNSERGINQMLGSRVFTAQPNISLANVTDFLIPVPPLEEQRRIVAKVDELMVLCNALKIQIADAANTQRQLADAIVEKAAA